MVIFGLNLKLGSCHSILGLTTNQKMFKYTLQQCIVYHVLENHGTAILKRHEEKFSDRRTLIKGYEWQMVELLP